MGESVKIERFLVGKRRWILSPSLTSQASVRMIFGRCLETFSLPQSRTTRKQSFMSEFDAGDKCLELMDANEAKR